MHPIKLDPETIYSERLLAELGIDETALKKARKEGKIRFRRIEGGVTYWYKGRWVIDWFESQAEGAPEAGEPVGAGGGGR